MRAHIVELLGILIALGLLIFLAFRGFTLLLAAPLAAIVAAAFSGEPLLAKWTITFMQATGRFIANFFPLFLLGGVFGKLMDDGGSALSIARGITEHALGPDIEQLNNAFFVGSNAREIRAVKDCVLQRTRLKQSCFAPDFGNDLPRGVYII